MPTPLIRRADQAVIATLTGVAILGATLWWVRAGGLRGGLVDIDAAAPLDYRFLVDVNRADWPELAQLPGIGPTLAKRIVASRGVEGDFRTADDLRRVNGIGPRTLEGMRRYLLPLPDDTQVAGAATSGEEPGEEQRGSSG
ncbi:ComE operon protein 1 [Botrimarina colliarenosi]|uniref:ComE operon protein 1 n=1 Tax=Botrimarina colliarenosi TaxID=2528001 RepID=A0A5C6ACD0_9BACT|nr:helix-hairpin-helix domain-containing protein [Botrimarina colliarenosi]TWT97047.1 ComE operon protein 1 [Botrimarina colliarenosi]